MHIEDLHSLPIMQFRLYPQYPAPRHVPQRFLVCVDVPLPSLCCLEDLSMEESGHCKVSSVAPRAVQSFRISAFPV